MGTVLTGELAEKRKQIGKSHNLRVLALFPLMALFVITIAEVLPRGFPHAFLISIAGLIASKAMAFVGSSNMTNRCAATWTSCARST